jgi:hypothetical protein
MNNETFKRLKLARKSKGLNSLILIHSTNENSFLRLCIEERSKFSDNKENVFLEIPVSIVFDSYLRSQDHLQLAKKVSCIEDTKRICFHESIYRDDSYILTILNMIKENSTIVCRVVAFNGCSFDEQNKQADIVRHQCYIKIDDKNFLFSSYVGANNTASPIQY